jgi:hypothetical protein
MYCMLMSVYPDHTWKDSIERYFECVIEEKQLPSRQALASLPLPFFQYTINRNSSSNTNKSDSISNVQSGGDKGMGRESEEDDDCDESEERQTPSPIQQPRMYYQNAALKWVYPGISIHTG